MITIIYPFRNRDLIRVENSFLSLKEQTCDRFEVQFVDYGSDHQTAEKTRRLCSQFSFVNYSYCYTEFQPWNKSRALNSVIKTLESGYCFVADVDIIFHPQFIEKAIQLQDGYRSTYFQVGFLSEGAKILPNHFSTGNYRKSTREATGLSMFPVKLLQELRGFDEFYHFWGAEDTDMHVRLENAGYEVHFYDKEILLLHQWHLPYRSGEEKVLTENLQIKGIVQLNHQYLQNTRVIKRIHANPKTWGEVMNATQLKSLMNQPFTFKLDNDKKKVDALIYGQLPQLLKGNFKVQIREQSISRSINFHLKRIAGKKAPEFYSLKEVNDLVLSHLISFYRDCPYIFKVNRKTGTIIFGIIKS